jgi:hypothetical protein
MPLASTHNKAHRQFHRGCIGSLIGPCVEAKAGYGIFAVAVAFGVAAAVSLRCNLEAAML